MANELKFASKVVFLNGSAITLPMSSSDPVPASIGDLYYNDASSTVRFYNGISWVQIATAGNSGTIWKAAVRVASTGNLNLASMPASVDGVTLTVGDRFLAKDQTISFENGIYIFNGTGVGATRATDAATAADINGAMVSTLSEGTINFNRQFFESLQIIAIGADPVTFIRLGENNLIGGDMITVVGTNIKVDLATVSGLESTIPGNDAGKLRAKVDGATIYIDGGNQLAVAIGGISDAQVSTGANIALTKLAPLAINRAVATDASGFLVASTTTAAELGFVAGVTSSIQTQLNGKLSLSGGTMTGSINGGGFEALNFANPTSAQSLATKAYVDAVAQGLKPKAAVRAASLANVNLASMPASLDGVTLTSGDRLLIKNQTLPQANGIYIFNGTGSAATRSPDMDSLTPIDEVNGAYTFIQSGTQAGQGWVEQSVVVVLGTDPMVWVYFNDVTTLTIGTFDGQAPSANGLVISGLSLFAQSASATVPGMVNNTTQTMSGAKTFSTSVTSPIHSTSTVNPATTGVFRLANAEFVSWRNAGNTANVNLAVDSSNNLNLSSGGFTLNGSTSGSFTQAAAAITTPYTIIWPASQGGLNTIPTNDGSGNLTWTAGSTFVPVWHLVTLTFASFSAAALSNDVSLVVLPAKTMLHQVVIKHSAPANGAGITTYTLSIGTATNFSAYAQPFDVKQAVTNIARSITQIMDVPNFSSTHDVRIQAVSTGANLNAATTGTFDIWYMTSQLP